MGAIPWAATGAGAPLVVLAGLSPQTGVASNRFVRATLMPVRQLAARRRIFVLNRRSHLAAGLTMSVLAAEYAEALRAHFSEPIDVIGLSTGGSLAQQLAADHPDVLRRLVLISTACRLGSVGRSMQAQVGTALRAGRIREASAIAAAGLLPRAGRLARGVGWLAAPRVIPDAAAAADLASTIEAEDGFDLAACRLPILAPTLIIAGGRDRYYSLALFEETAGLIANCQLRVYPKKGHLAVVSDRNARAHIEGFLAWQA